MRSDIARQLEKGVIFHHVGLWRSMYGMYIQPAPAYADADGDQ